MTIPTQNNLLAKLSIVSKGLIGEYQKIDTGVEDDRRKSLNKIKTEYNRLKSFIGTATAKTPDTQFDGDLVLLENQLRQHQNKFK